MKPMADKPAKQRNSIRLRAEESLRALEEASPDRLPLEDKRLLHELEVYKIELELQNQELHSSNTQLAEHRNQLLNIIKMTPAGYFHIDLEGRILEVNDAWLRMHGYESADEVVGKHFSITQIDSDSESALKHMAELQRGKAIPAGEFVSRRKDGSIGHHTFSAHPVVHYGGVVGFEWFIIDISDRIRAEEEVKKKNVEMEQFMYTVSHDLRSPLVTIKGFTGYLEEDVAEGNHHKVTQDLQFINAAADKMRLLLDELLKMYRVGRIEDISSPLSLKELLAEALDAVAGDVRTRKATIVLPATEIMLLGDRLHLCQIWQNLIENSLKYCSKDSIPQIELGVLQGSEAPVFFVKDNGIGIEAQYLKKIFGIFEKLDQNSSGAGMGLSMIQRIVEGYSGKIWVESDGVGKGACFFFTLPRAIIQT
jgi:PAS domain S-box-containing protein